ncbi:MAG: amidohydrolase [Alteromonadales bacterium]|nr:amidohydrolase [Alteromonadales bacterium]
MDIFSKQKRLYFFAIIMTCITSLVGCSQEIGEPPLNQDKNTLWYGGPIITMDETQPRAEAVVSDSNGKIVFVGNLSEAKNKFPSTQEHNLNGHTMMAGFIEQHLHPFLAALSLSIPVVAPEAWEIPGKIWPAAPDEKSYFARLIEIEANMKNPDEIFWSWGYNNYFHGYLNRRKLDEISTTRPIAIWHRSVHEFFLNSAAIEYFGINQQDINKFGKEVIEQSNITDGHFFESGALLYLLPIIFPELGNAHRFKAGLEQMVEMLHRKGVTAYNEPGAFIPEPMVPLYAQVLASENTPMYSYFIAESKTPYFTAGSEGVLKAVEDVIETFGDNSKVKFLDKHLKILADGAIVSQFMMMRDGYLDGHHGEWIQPPAEMEAISKVFWEKDYQLHIHVNGDKGLDEIIALLKRRQKEFPRDDHRTTIVHFANSTVDQIQELADLGVIVSANPYYVTGFGERFSEVGLGAERAHAMARLGPVEKAGISVSLHSDMPIAPSDPLYLVWSAVTRKSSTGNPLRPDLAMSLEGALRAITIDAAYSWRMEDTLGSITTGKVANFTILAEDPYQVELDHLKDIEIEATVFEGKLYPVKSK